MMMMMMIILQIETEGQLFRANQEQFGGIKTCKFVRSKNLDLNTDKKASIDILGQPNRLIGNGKRQQSFY